MKISDEDLSRAEELFVDQAAHLFLALAGIKPLPKQQSDSKSKGVMPD